MKSEDFLKKNDSVKNFYRSIKKAYYSIFGNPRSYKKDLKYLKDCSLILDVGCGHGYFAETNPNSIIGVDFNIDSLHLCGGKGIKAINASALKLPFKDNTFDGVHCAHIIEHFTPEKAQILLKEINRVTRTSGIVLIKTPMPNKYFYNEPTHVRPYPPLALLELLGLTMDGQYTISRSNSSYRFVDLFFSRRRLLQPSVPVSIAPGKYIIKVLLKGIGMAFSNIGIRHWEKSDYTMVLKKI